MICAECKIEFAEEEIYLVQSRAMCEDCASNTDLFPLEHTGIRRDKISERGRE